MLRFFLSLEIKCPYLIRKKRDKKNLVYNGHVNFCGQELVTVENERVTALVVTVIIEEFFDSKFYAINSRARVGSFKPALPLRLY